jgi:transcriptional regulator with XRE-family HTH domain
VPGVHRAGKGAVRVAKERGKAVMEDVARRAGVSIATVSRVINGTAPVSEATAERVRSAVRALGYEINHVAKSLRQGATHTVAVIVGDLGNPFYADFIKGVESAAQRARLSVMVCTAPGGDDVAQRQVQVPQSSVTGTGASFREVLLTAVREAANLESATGASSDERCSPAMDTRSGQTPMGPAFEVEISYRLPPSAVRTGCGSSEDSAAHRDRHGSGGSIRSQREDAHHAVDVRIALRSPRESAGCLLGKGQAAAGTPREPEETLLGRGLEAGSRQAIKLFIATSIPTCDHGSLSRVRETAANVLWRADEFLDTTGCVRAT